jgi:hypothetical protein
VLNMTDDHLTSIPEVPDKANAVPGMAHFAGTGPPGKCCRDCEFCGYVRRRAETWDPIRQMMVAKAYNYGGCEMHRKLTGRHGAEISKANKACKYFKQSLAAK